MIDQPLCLYSILNKTSNAVRFDKGHRLLAQIMIGGGIQNDSIRKETDLRSGLVATNSSDNLPIGAILILLP